MKYAQFIKALKSKGVSVSDGSRHAALRYGGKMTTLTRHPSKDIPRQTIVKIVKSLGITRP